MVTFKRAILWYQWSRLAWSGFCFVFVHCPIFQTQVNYTPVTVQLLDWMLLLKEWCHSGLLLVILLFMTTLTLLVLICKLRAVNLFSKPKEIYAKRSRHASKPKFKKQNLLQSGHLGVGGRPLCKLCGNVTAQNEKIWIDTSIKIKTE